MSSIVDTIRGTLAPIHPDGYKFVAAFFVATVLAGWLWAPLFVVGLALTIWCAAFFRDPVRVTPVDGDLVVAPGDGRIVAVTPASPPAELGLGTEPRLRISIFLSLLDCHICRAPVGGRITRIAYRAGKFVNASLDKASEDNERNGLVVELPAGDAVAVVQIAGLVARRILCFANEGQGIMAGDRFGLIRFGSRLDVYLPPRAAPRIAEGQRTIGGETVIAALTGDGGPPVTRVS